MAEAYTRLIELKVKDTDLGRALNKLTNSLEKIEKKLDEIGGKGGKGFAKVTKGADKAAASLKKLQATSNGVAKASGYVRASIVGLGAGLVASNAAVTALDRSLRKVWDPLGLVKKLADQTTGSLLAQKASFLATAAAAPLLTKALVAGAAAYVLFGSKIFNVKKQLTGFVDGVQKAKKTVREFIKGMKIPSGGGSELTIFDRIQSAKGGGLVGLRKLLDQVTAAQSKLISTNLGYVASSQQVRAVEKALNAELMARKRIMDQIIMNEQRRTPTSSLTAAAGQAGGLEGLRNLLAEAQGIQDRMLTTNENYKVASARVRNIQKAINAELERRDKIMGKVNEKEQKSVSLGERLRGIAGNLGGRAVQAARPGRGIERRSLIAGGVGGLAGLGMASNTAVGGALGTLGSKTMGFAGMTAGAGAHLGIPGMGVAAKGIADTKVAMTGLVTAAKGVAAVNVLNPAFVAALGVAWMAFGTKGFTKVIKGLSGVHKGSVSLLNQFLGIEKASTKFDKGLIGLTRGLIQTERFLAGTRQEIKLNDRALRVLGHTAEETNRKLLVGQGKNKGSILQNLRASKAGRATSGFTQWEASLDGTGTASARDLMVKSLERKNRRLVQLGKEKLKGERLITGELKKQNNERDKAVNKQQQQIDRMFTDKARRERRMNAKFRKMGRGMGMNRLDSKGAESLMLGAGFPLLFGGGLGATAGGITGSVVGNALGMGGFGTQIIGSAIGTMLENILMKANALGEKLKTLNMEELKESGIKVNTQLSLQIDQLKEIGNLNEARRLVEIEIFKATGALPGTHESISRTVKALGDAWNRVSTTIGTTLGILASPFMAVLSKILNMANAVFSVVNGVLSVFTALDRSMGELIMGSDKYRLHMWEASEAGKKARIEAERKLRIVKEEMALAGKLMRIDLKRPLGNTFDDRRTNIGLDFDASVLKADTDLKQAMKKVTMDKDLGGEGHKPGSTDAQIRFEAITLKYNQALDDAYKAKLRQLLLLDKEEQKTLYLGTMNNKQLMDQLLIQKKIKEAKERGDFDTVSRLTVESQILAVQYELNAKLQEELTTTQELQAVIEAILKIKKLKLEAVDQTNEAWKRVNQTVRNDVQQGIKGLIKGTSTWADMLNNVADKFLDIALNQAFYGNMMGKMGKGGIFGALAGFGASIFKPSGTRAAGGPVTGGNSYVVGERGPELFVPRSGGNIVSNNAMGNVTVNVDASGSSAQGDGPSSEQLGQLIGAAIQNELIRQKRPGGLLG